MLKDEIKKNQFEKDGKKKKTWVSLLNPRLKS